MYRSEKHVKHDADKDMDVFAPQNISKTLLIARNQASARDTDQTSELHFEHAVGSLQNCNLFLRVC